MNPNPIDKTISPEPLLLRTLKESSVVFGQVNSWQDVDQLLVDEELDNIDMAVLHSILVMGEVNSSLLQIKERGQIRLLGTLVSRHTRLDSVTKSGNTEIEFPFSDHFSDAGHAITGKMMHLLQNSQGIEAEMVAVLPNTFNDDLSDEYEALVLEDFIDLLSVEESSFLFIQEMPEVLVNAIAEYQQLKNIQVSWVLEADDEMRSVLHAVPMDDASDIGSLSAFVGEKLSEKASNLEDNPNFKVYRDKDEHTLMDLNELRSYYLRQLIASQT